ncbi:MAG: PadR family transcriptional regulator [Anaerolineae bacterium]|nr:PadR family transcriptional regulator [Anaerolineae bacterium]
MSRDDAALPQPVLLGFLMPGPRHGYELYREFSRDLGRVWRIGLSQLYAQLKQLESAGLVEVRIEPQPNRPARKVYHLTAAGREAFLDWVSQPASHLRHMRLDLLARLYFFRYLSLPGLAQLVARQKAVCQEQAERFGRLAAETDDDFGRLVLEFRKGQMEAATRWLDRCLEVLCP